MHRDGPDVVVIENDPTGLAGHWISHLVGIGRSLHLNGGYLLVVSETELSGPIGQELKLLGVVSECRSKSQRARVLYRLSRFFIALGNRIVRHSKLRRFGYQSRNFGLALLEADNLRRARAASADAPIVLLTGLERLNAFVAFIAGCKHIRWVHDVYAWNSPLFRALDTVFKSGYGRFVCLVPGGVELTNWASSNRRAAVHKAVFALKAEAPTGEASALVRFIQARVGTARGIAIVGLWHRKKDPAVVRAALDRIPEVSGLHFIFVGSQFPYSDPTFESRSDITIIPYPVSQSDLEGVYAVSSTVLVSRKDGCGSGESGNVLDALGRGLLVIASDNMELKARAGQVATYRTGDARSLSEALLGGLAKPTGEHAECNFEGPTGMLTPADMVALYRATHRRLNRVKS